MKHNDTEFQALVVLQIEPENAKFFPANDLGYKNASDKFNLAGTGDGSAAGFAKCDADFELTANGDNTLLYYWARADTDG